LVFSGDRQNRDAPCAGERVYLNGDNGRFVLHGGCAGVAVRGDGDIAQVELAPGAPIAIAGNASVVYFTVTSPGGDPTLIVTGSNSHAIRVGHLGEVNGAELPAAARAGLLMPPAANVPGTQVTVLTPQAALAAAQGETIVQLQRNLGAVQTPQGTQVRLPGDVLFDFDQDTLRPDAQRSLAELSTLARDHPRELQIVGYTDSIGTPQYNLDLSDRRARNVERRWRSWMCGAGAPAIRLRRISCPTATTIRPAVKRTDAWRCCCGNSPRPPRWINPALRPHDPR
jgi:OmpA family